MGGVITERKDEQKKKINLFCDAVLFTSLHPAIANVVLVSGEKACETVANRHNFRLEIYREQRTVKYECQP